MRYLLLVYAASPERWEHPMFAHHPEYRSLPDAERERLAREAEELRREITESGELVEGTALADPALTRTVRGVDGVPVATDGPYLEAKEQLAGYFVLDCDRPERAHEIARRFPDARLAAVEVRPIMHTGGEEM